MTGQEAINPNVVLTADTTQYDQSMNASAQSTDALANSVDTLTNRINSLTKKAAHVSFGIAAADIASITAATAAWASYEHQMTRLNAQAAITTRNTQDQTRVMQQYTQAVSTLRETYGASTSQSADLVSNIAKITENKNVRALTGMSKIFMDMSKATGENSTGLATSLLSLQKVMGTPINTNATRKYADQLTYLSQQTSTSAQGLAEFATQLAPVGRLLGFNQTQIMGVATAFSKAGADGYQAASTFNKVVSDIAYSTQTGSPDLAKYANLVGMTVDQFSKLSGQEKVLRFFDSLNTLGPRAITQLNRMGYDGMRTMRAVTAMANQTGGLRVGIQQAYEGLESNASSKGAAAAKDMVEVMQQIKQEVQETAEIFAERFGPAVEKVLEGVEKITAAFKKMMEGPLGDVLQAVAVVGGTLALAAGSALSAAAPLATLAGGALLWRGSGMMGFREGRKGAPPVTAGVTEENQGQVGRAIAANGSWFQRYSYNAGNLAGRGAAIAGAMLPPREGAPLWQRAAAMGMNAGAWGLRMGQSVYSPLTIAGYGDPTRRMRMFTDARSPWAQAKEAFQSRWSGLRPAEAATPTSTSAPLSPYIYDHQGRIIGRASEVRVRASEVGVAQSAAVRTTAVREANVLAAQFANVSRAAGGLAGSLASASAQATILAGRGVGKIAPAIGRSMANSPMMWGMGAMAVGSQLGIDNTAFTLGTMGMMWNPALGVAGAGAGMLLDARAQNQNWQAAKASYQESLKTGTISEQFQQGQALLAGADQVRALQQPSRTGLSAAIMGDYTPSQVYGQIKMGLTGLWQGGNPVSDRLNAAEQTEKQQQATASAWMSIASAKGNRIDSFNFSDPDSWRKLDAVVQSVTPAMEKLGLTTEDVTKAWEEGGDAWTKMMDQLVKPGQYSGLWDRIRGTNASGAMFMDSGLVQRALQYSDNANLQYRAMNQQVAGSIRGGMSFGQIIQQRGNVLARIGDPDSPEYQLNQAVIGQAQQGLGYQLPFMSRAGGYQQQANLFAGQANLYAGDPNQQQKMAEAQQQFMQSTVGQVQYFQQLLYQQREFNVSQSRAYEDFAITRDRMEQAFALSRSRAQQDYGIMRHQQEEDYQLSRKRAEEDYNLTRERAEESFGRSMNRAHQDFTIQRLRQEQDYQHQVKLMTEQSAQQMYDIYNRVNVQRTNSASYLLVNAQDQLTRMRQQEANLARLRKMGASDDTIQAMGFTDSANAQQLARFVAEAAADPRLIREFNQSIAKRLKAAGALTTNQSSRDWQEFQRQYKLQRDRAQEDFTRSIKRARQDFRIQMDQMEEDYHKMMSRGAEDFEKMQKREAKAFGISMHRAAQDYAISEQQMQEDFSKSMVRAQEDLDRSAQEITGTLHSLLVDATENLHGTAAKQAAKVLATFTHLKTQLGITGNDIMTYMAKIFGFDYTPVKITQSGGTTSNAGDPTKTGSGQGQASNPHDQGGMAAGGVLNAPRSVGSDNMHFYSKDHGSLSLAGGEAIMVPEWVDMVGGPAAVARMNKFARQGYAGGGVVNPDEKVYINGMAISRVAAAQIGLARQIWGLDGLYMMQGGYGGNHVPASGTSHNYPGVGDFAPGSIALETDLRKVGFAAWARNQPGRVYVGSGQHVHAISLIDPGDKSSPQVYGSWPSHSDGYEGGPGSDPAPHPPWVPNLIAKVEQIAGTMNLSGVATGSGDGSGAYGPSPAQLAKRYLKKRYDAVEKAAADVVMGQGLFRNGFWSDKLNQWTMEKIKPYMKRQTYTTGTTGAGYGGGTASTAHEAGVKGGSNQQIVHRAMLAAGYPESQWGPLYNLIMGESGFNNTAQNPSSSAYGIFQFLDSTWAGVGGHKTSDPGLQSLYGMRYIKERYGNPAAAYSAWLSRDPHWYREGAIFDGAQTIGVGEGGPEAVIPLNHRGADFMAELMRKTSAGLEARGTNTAHYSQPLLTNSIHTYNIDRSTTFTGDIVVRANNPQELIQQLRDRNRAMALSQASLGGRRV